MSPSLFNALVIFFSGGIVAIASWAAPRLIPSAFSRYPGGVENARWRWGIGAVLLTGLALAAGGLAAVGFPVVLAILFPLMASVPVGALVLACVGIFQSMMRSRRIRPHRPSRPGSIAAPPSMDPFAARRVRRDLQWRQLLQTLAHPYGLVPGAQAQAAFEAAQTRGQTEGFSPLIVLPGFGGPISAEPLSLKDSKVRMASEYFEWRAHDFGRYTDELALFDHVNEIEPRGSFGQLYVVDWLSGTMPLSPHAEIAILRLPCAEPWKIPLLVGFGPPLDESRRTVGEEIGITKDWYERFSAELCCVGDRSWQFRVTRPPRSHREAVELLRQHYLYSWVDGAYDKEHIENGAAVLRVSTYWQFFWT